MPEFVATDQQQDVLTVTLNRPQARNALSRAVLIELAEVFRGLSTDVLAVVLTGADPVFCAGVDLREIASDGGPVVSGVDAVEAIMGCGRPVIGAINGAAVTGGLELALACDFRIGSERARFADTHARVGVMPGWGLTVRLPRAVGKSWARQMSFTGNYVDAATALRIGLVNEVAPHDDLLARAKALAADIATVDPADLAQLREMYDRVEQALEREALDYEQVIGEQRMAAFDPAAVGARREAVLARGRAQQA